MTQKDTLDSTFAKYFGPTEETSGTGTVIRVSDGILQQVIVDPAEHAAFQAANRAEAQARVAAFWQRVAITEQVNR